MTEIQALQNVANDLELFVHEKFEQDKRKTTKKYFLTLNGTSVSPVLDYENMNAFLMGWLNAKKYNSAPLFGGEAAPENKNISINLSGRL